MIIKEPIKNKLLQTEDILNQMIKWFGCNLMSLLGILQDYLQILLTGEQINYIYSRCVADRLITPKCAFLKDCKFYFIPEIVCKILGLTPMRCYQLGTSLSPNKRYVQGWTNIVPDGVISHYNVLDKDGNIKIDSDGENARHYVQADLDGKIIYNPDPDIKLGPKVMDIYYKLYKIEN